MESLPVGTTVFRSFDEQTYVKETYSENVKTPCTWRTLKHKSNAWGTGVGHVIFVSDTTIQTNTKQFSDIKKP